MILYYNVVSAHTGYNKCVKFQLVGLELNLGTSLHSEWPAGVNSISGHVTIPWARGVAVGVYICANT